MTRSESINELAAALAQAQGTITNAKRDSENPHFRHRYADLASIWDACRAALSAHGLSVIQSPRLMAAGEALWVVEVETTLLHQSGQSLSDVLAVPVAAVTPQGVGSAITYARRYALAAFVGVAPEDDDAQLATVPDRQIRRAADEEAPPPSAMDTDEGVKIVGIVKRVLPSGKEKFILSGLVGDAPKSYGTFSIELATDAKAAKELNAPVEIIIDLRVAQPEPPL